MSKTYSQVRYAIPPLDSVLQSLKDRIVSVHEACQSVPEASQQDFDEVVDSIKADGLHHPIQIDSEKRLLDGRCRLQACAVLGLELSDSDIVTIDHDPWSVARTNLARRHLTDDQKAMLAVCLLKQERAKAAERKKLGAEKGRKSESRSLGTAAVPSGKQPKKRAPRSSAVVAAKTAYHVKSRDCREGC